jgi:hypothetical protein
VPVSTRTRVVRIIGRDRVTAVEVERDGRRRLVECDTVVFSADWIPDHELARLHGIELDAGTLGPLVDTALRTSRPGIFAAGNLLHPVDTADVAALDGRQVAETVLDWLRHGTGTGTGTAIRLHAGAGLRWITPGLIEPGGASRSLSAWADQAIRRPLVVIEQDGRTRAGRRLAWLAAPGRVTRIPAGLVSALDPAGGDATVSLRS